MEDFVTRMRVSFHRVTGLATARAARQALHYRSKAMPWANGSWSE